MEKPVFLFISYIIFLSNLCCVVKGQSYLTPQYINLAVNKTIHATSTCGVHNGQPFREMFCNLAGASKYVPSPIITSISDPRFAELRIGDDDTQLRGGQNCEICDGSVAHQAHGPEKMNDQTADWWQSPPLSRGMDYNQVNITIDLGQEFHVAYVNLFMANSPRPALWVLERSSDYGKTYQPWQWFAENTAQCVEFFGADSIQPILEDDSVICNTEYSQIVPLENGEIIVRLVSGRPGAQNFTHSERLQNFIKATNVRIRLLRTKTLQGHLMDLNDRNDPTITRRYFYGVKEIEMGGRCVCNGHAQTCDILDPIYRPNRLLCRCEHNTCGDQCERCCPGFEQKKWGAGREGRPYVCEPCNCHGHSEECTYDPEIDRQGLSLDIHGRYEGGGVCRNCRDNTEGINCHKCRSGFYRPYGRPLNVTNVCEPCVCDPYYHTNNCNDGNGQCECKPRFKGPDCRECSKGYYDYPACKPCECDANGTSTDDVCLPQDGQCPCKPNFGGTFCKECADGFYNFPNCTQCKCDATGSTNGNCDKATGQCQCRPNYANTSCDSCANGSFNYPDCKYCDCDNAGTLPNVCDKNNGTCLCKPGFAGERCDRCADNHYGFPNCQPCDCDSAGSSGTSCHPDNGQCTCKVAFTGRKCNKCTAGYYDYPKCLNCNCDKFGSFGTTCSDRGDCFCRPNFEGIKCDRCKANFYNFPMCEECNCDPKGVSLNFAGCDKVPKGELCTCKERVTGRICNECKPTFWNLQYFNALGCEDCACNLAGTLSRLNDCDDVSGQCQCKLLVGGRDCTRCKDGYYNLQLWNQFGCQPCECDVGGSFSQICDESGQCRCKGRISGRACNQPIDTHYFPTLLHMQYEAEDGRTPDHSSVRFATDSTLFPNYSWRGYAVFSPIQEKILLHIDIQKSSIYRLVLHTVNPTSGDVSLFVEFDPQQTYSDDDAKQPVDVKIAPSTNPQTMVVTKNASPQPFVLNRGRWILRLKTKQRLYLDFVALLPAAYYEATILREDVKIPCLAKNDGGLSCKDFRYASITSPRAFAADVYQSDNGGRKSVGEFAVDRLPATVGKAAWLQGKQPYKVDVTVPKPGNYVVVIDYSNLLQEIFPIDVEVVTHDYKQQGGATFHHCPYSFCREVVASDGQPTAFRIDQTSTPATVTMSPSKDLDLALHSVSLIPFDDWTVEYLLPKAYCTRRSNECIGSEFLNPASTMRVEVESGPNKNNSVVGTTLPLGILDPAVEVLPLDTSNNKFEVIGEVKTPDQYIFIVQYYSPKYAKVNLDVSIMGDRAYEMLTGHKIGEGPSVNSTHAKAYLPLGFCPSISGCRAVVRQKGTNGMTFDITKKFVASFFMPNGTQDPIYIDYLMVVPLLSHSDDVLEPIPGERSGTFLSRCSKYLTDPSVTDVDPFCKSQIFSITMENNMGALPCGCDLHGSTSLSCASFGGQCTCKENVIGRRCTQCKPGTYGFPECKPCNCDSSQQCDPHSGQCFCPPHVEGKNCDRCIPQAYGFDPLIGCQECSCNRQGSEHSLECDQLNGQCKCKPNVSGRQCDKCVAGFYGFPYCYQCSCAPNGTTADICDQNNAQCLCKENVYGQLCDTCIHGTYYLEARNPKGCSDCFCFGTTSACRSSTWRKSKVMDTDGWTLVNGEGGTIGRVNGAVEATFPDPSTQTTGGIYLAAPQGFLGKKLTSYGGRLSYKIASTPAEGVRAMPLGPDVILKGHNLTLEYWNAEQPSEPGDPLTVAADFLPDQWRINGRGLATRAQLMMALNHVSALHIRASYPEKISKARLSDILLDTAIDDPNAPTDHATNVEQCHCPPPYKGLSCEECAEGYYRIATGPFLGTCVPCQCNGHSNKCDAASGICFDCQHNTFGEHCEKCAVGHYGDATRGTMFDCQICACPHATLENNFATGCTVTDAGLILSCQCKEGYTGDRCENCAVGYFGNPLELGGRCDRCFCNENNDLSVTGSCDARTGYCRMCKMNTTGPYCDICAEWNYGDAIHRKDCKACTCDICGSQICEHESGRCMCKQNVVGENCDRCAPDAWGFNRCGGCQLCQCGPASSTTQCDLENGQCACMPGVTGLQCDRCKPGYWQYGTQGCKKCDCEWDLSVGTVCDVNTGRCQCMPGATGPRCDQCLDNFLRIPDRGCFFCDQCVHVLVDDLDVLDNHISKSENDLRGVSALYLTNRRLARINDTVGQLKNKSNEIVSSGNGKDAGVGEVAKMAETVRKSGQDLKIKTDRAFSAVNETEQKLARIQADLEAFNGEIWTKTMDGRSVVMKIQELADSIGAATIGRPSSDERSRDASRFLDTIKAINLEPKHEKATEALTEAEKALNKAQAVVGSRHKVKNSTTQSRDRVATLVSKLNEHKDFVGQSRSKASQAEATGHRATSHPYYIAGLRFESEIAQSTEKLGNASELRTKAKEVTKMLKDSYKNISESLQTLNQSASNLHALTGNVAAVEPQNNELVTLAIRRSYELQPEADRLRHEFAHVRHDSHEAVKAAQVYNNIGNAIKSAKQAVDQAIKDFQGLSLGGFGDIEANLKVQTNNALKAHREALKSRSIVVNELRGGLKTSNDTLNRLHPRFAEVQTELAKLGIEKQPTLRQETQARLAQTHQIRNEANKICQDVDSELGRLKENIASLKNRSSTAVGFGVGGEFGLKGAQAQIAKATPEVNNAVERFKVVKGVADRVGAHLNNVSLLLEDLKEKVAKARDLANRAQFGTRFYPNSTLQVSNPPGFARSSAYTLLTLYFNTAVQNGLLFFMGNERNTYLLSRAVPTDDYLMLEIHHGRVKLTYRLGSDVATAESRQYVSDSRWHKVTVERTNKIATLTVETENEPADKQRVAAEGTGSLLNLDQEASKIFVGGVPTHYRLPVSIPQNFDGQIDDVTLNGQKLGLWNFADDHRRNTYGVPKRKEMKPSTTSSPGVHFNGNGYVEMSKELWNPRKETNVKLSFKTYALKGLLFFIGKGDFFALELRDGRVVLSFNFGGGMAQIVTTKTYNDGMWHLVDVQRTGKDATLTMDMDGNTTQKATSPGTHTDLDVADVYYIGGTKTPHRHREVTNVGFQGCIDRVHVGGSLANLNSHISAIFIEPGCEPKPVQVLSIDGPGGWAEITPLKLGGDVELIFKFKTKKQNALILWLTDESRINSLAVTLESGRLLIISTNNGGQAAKLKEESKDYSDGKWHYVTVTRKSNMMKVDVDDFYTRETTLNLVGQFQATEKASLYFGLPSRADLPSALSYLATASFIGCVGDVAYDSQLLNFNNASRSPTEISLVGCPLPDPVESNTIEGAAGPDSYAASQLSEPPPATSVSAEPTHTPILSLTEPAMVTSSESSIDDEGCALRASAVNPVDARGYRLGRETHARIEYDKIPGSIDKKANFSFQFRASSTNGIMFYVTNADKTDYIAVFMKNGKLVFSYDSGSGAAVLESNRTFLDHNWHTVSATREGKTGKLLVDSRLEARGSTKGATDVINVDRPFFVGGLPPEWLNTATKKHVMGIANSFGGCLRDFNLDGIPFSEPAAQYQVAPCSEFFEKGLYFGARGGYAVIKPEFSVGSSFTFELEIKPRVRNAVLLAVSSSSQSDFLTVQILNGILKYGISTGSVPQHLTNAFDAQKMDLCDGHWHMIKIVKVKNVMTLSIDGVTKTHTIKKIKSLDIDTKDPLYLGGVPTTYNGKGLDTKNSFVGCIRTIKVNNGKDKARRRKQAQVRFEELTLVGDMTRDSCIVN